MRGTQTLARTVAAAAVLVALLSILTLDALALQPPMREPLELVLTPPANADKVTGSVRMSSGRTLSVSLVARSLVRIDADPAATIPAEAQNDVPAATPQPACGAPNVCIGPGSIKVDPSSLTLVPSIPANVNVTVSDLARPGTYRGTIEVYAALTAPKHHRPDKGRVTSSIVVTLRVTKGPGLVLSPSFTTISATKVQESDSFSDRILTDLFLSPAEERDDIAIPLTNQSADAVRVNAEVIALGSKTGHQLSATVLTNGQAQLPGIQAVDPTLELDRGNEPLYLRVSRAEADTFSGYVYLNAPNDAPAQAIPVSVVIRQLPTWPLILIILGVLLGWAAQLFLATGIKLASAADRLDSLGDDIDSSGLPSALRQSLRDRVEAARGLLNHGGSDAAVAKMDSIGTSLNVYLGANKIEADYPAGHPRPADFDTKIRIIRDLANAGLDKEAADALKELRKACIAAGSPAISAELGGASAPDTEPWYQPWLDRLGEMIVGTSTAGGGPFNTVIALPGVRLSGFGTLLLVILAALVVGSTTGAVSPIPLLIVAVVVAVALAIYLARKRIKAVWRRRLRALQLARWPLQGVLALALSVVGFQLLYVQQGTTLLGGQIDPIVQYVFWGLGANIASRTLTTFRGS